jgi:hypothetical protein
MGNIGEERRRIEVLPARVPDRVPDEVPERAPEPAKPVEPAPAPTR